MTEPKDVNAVLVRLLSNEGIPRPFKGNQLSVLVKTYLPDFDPEKFGCRNLRAFIKKFSTDEIMEVGKAGMDVIYGLRSVGQQPPLFETSVESLPKIADQRAPLRQLLADPRIWKTFVSPDTQFRLFFSPATKQVQVLRPGRIPDASWVEMPHVSAEVLLQIAKDFIAQLPDIQRGPLLTALDQPRWWIGFYDLTNTLGVKMRWVYFRRRRIAEEFERAISTLPIQPDVPAIPRDSGSTSPVVQPGPTTAVSSATPRSLLKDVATDAVQRMTDSELRSLNLPLGYVIDALTSRQ